MGWAALLNQALLLGILFQAGALAMRSSSLQRGVGFAIMTAYFALCIVLQKHDGETGSYLAALSSSFIVWGFLFDVNRAWSITMAAANAAIVYGVNFSLSAPST